LDGVFSAMEQVIPGERDIFIAGDFNLVPANLSQAVSVRISTIGTGSTLNAQGNLTNNVYDHFLVLDENATSELIGDPAIIDVRTSANNNKIFFDTVSDHLPVLVRLRASGPDDD